jgi:hypothetical protein
MVTFFGGRSNRFAKQAARPPPHASAAGLTSYFGTERIKPRVPQALPKYVIGTTKSDGVTPGWPRRVIGHEPSSFCVLVRNVTAR